jgi:hypothetical protein
MPTRQLQKQQQQHQLGTRKREQATTKKRRKAPFNDSKDRVNRERNKKVAKHYTLSD